MTTYATILQAMPWIAAAVVILVLCAIGLGIWITLPRSRDDDIDRQIATLRQGADHAVKTRPRVRAHSTRAPSMPLRSCDSDEFSSPPLKPCGGGLCRHRADCADHYCPGRLAAGLSGVTPPHPAPKADKRGGTVSYSFSSTTQGPTAP